MSQAIQADGEFVEILGKIREGRAGSQILEDLQRRCRAPVEMNGILATKLFTHREDVDQLNARELKSLPGDPVRFVARDSGSAELLQNGCPAKQVLELKVGAQVMLMRNISQARGLVNGARGIVERFSGRHTPLPVVRFANGHVTTMGKERWAISSGSSAVASRQQIPLELGWAMSVHKCQGMTLDAVQINLDRAFEPGMAYVALSRVKSIEGLQIVGSIHPKALQAHPKVTAFYSQLKQVVAKLSQQRLGLIA